MRKGAVPIKYAVRITADEKENWKCVGQILFLTFPKVWGGQGGFTASMPGIKIIIDGISPAPVYEREIVMKQPAATGYLQEKRYKLLRRR